MTRSPDRRTHTPRSLVAFQLHKLYNFYVQNRDLDVTALLMGYTNTNHNLNPNPNGP